MKTVSPGFVSNCPPRPARFPSGWDELTESADPTSDEPLASPGAARATPIQTPRWIHADRDPRGDRRDRDPRHARRAEHLPARRRGEGRDGQVADRDARSRARRVPPRQRPIPDAPSRGSTRSGKSRRSIRRPTGARRISGNRSRSIRGGTPYLYLFPGQVNRRGTTSSLVRRRRQARRRGRGRGRHELEVDGAAWRTLSGNAGRHRALRVRMPTYAYQAVDGSGKRLRGHAQAVSSGRAHAYARGARSASCSTSPSRRTAKAAAAADSVFGRRREVLEVTRAMAALLPGRHAARAGAERRVGRGVAATSQDALHEVTRTRRARRNALDRARAPSPRCSRRSTSDSCAPARGAAISTARSRASPTSSTATRQLRGKVLSASIYPMHARDGRLDRRHRASLLRAAALRDAARGQRRDAAALHVDAARVLVAAASRLAGAAAHSVRHRRVRGVGRRTPTKGAARGRRRCSRFRACSTLRRYALAGRFARLVGVLLGGGAPLLTALDDTIESIGDPIARDDAVAHSHARARGQLAARRAWPKHALSRRCSRS